MSVALDTEDRMIAQRLPGSRPLAAALAADILLPWRNPAFKRFFRSRLRFRKALFWCLVTLIITTFVVTLGYTLRTNAFQPPDGAARTLWVPLLLIQGLILMVKGTGSVSAGLIQDKIDQTLDYQRLTPVSPLRNLVGYLFGLPALEYVMFALTLPHLAFVAVVGQIPPATLLSVYCSFFVCVVLYHMTGIAAGMVMRRWLFAYLLSMLLVLFVNVILPSFVSQLGLKFLQYLSVWPVIGQKVLPVVSGSSVLAAGANPFLSVFGDVPFYDWTLSPFVFTLLLQGSLIITFGVMAVRRWKSSTKHSLSKPYAFAFLSAFIVVLIGNVWPIVTRDYMPFALFGVQNLNDLGEVVAFGLPLVYTYVVWMLCLILFTIIVPSHHDFVRGIRRAMKHGRPSARLWEDDSAALTVYALFTAVAVAGLAVLFREISAAGFLTSFDGAPPSTWRLPLALALVSFYTALLLQALGLRRTMLVVLVLWFLPILVSIVLSARTGSFETVHAVIHSLSPLAFVLMSGAPGVEIGPSGTLEGPFSALATGANTGLAAVAVQVVALWLLWSRHRRASYALCRRPTQPEGQPGTIPNDMRGPGAGDPSAAPMPLEAAST